MLEAFGFCESVTGDKDTILDYLENFHLIVHEIESWSRAKCTPVA